MGKGVTNRNSRWNIESATNLLEKELGAERGV
jgi:hypothetical protein